MDEEAELLLNQAKIFMLKNRFEKAEAVLASLVSADPENAQAKSLLSICRAKARAIPDAERLAKEALGTNPSSPHPHLALAMLKAEQGNNQEASSAFEKAIALSPNDSFFYLQYALFLKKTGKMPEALSAAEKAGRLDPEIEGLQPLISGLKAGMPKKTAEPLPEHGEIHNSWFYAKVPDTWAYSFDPGKNMHFFADEQIQGALVTLAPLPGTPAELADFKGNFYSFVASDAGAKPARMSERKMRVGNASDVHVSVDENGIKTRKVYVGYPHKDLFYVACASCPESMFPQFSDKFENFISSFLPRGVSPKEASSHSATPANALGMKQMALLAGLGLLGAMIALAGIFLLATSALAGFQPETGSIYLFIIILGYLPMALLAFKLSPKLVYILHMIYFLLLAACAGTAYIAMSGGSMLGTIMLAISLALAVASILLAVSALLLAKSKNREFHEAYPEFYAMAKEKYIKALP